MSSIPGTACMMLISNIMVPAAVAATLYVQSRPKERPSLPIGLRPKATMRSPATWKARNFAALRWSKWDPVLTWLVALVCMLFLRSWQLSFALRILFCCYSLSMALNMWHSTRVAAAVIDTQTDRPAGSMDGGHR